MYDPNFRPKRSCLYNPKFDREPVNPSGAIDLRAAFVNGSIPGDVIIEEEAFNGVDDPSTLLPRPKDNFERMRQGTYVKESLRVAKANAEASQLDGAATN